MLNLHPVKVGKRKRYSYARIKEVMAMPHLLDIQRNSYDWFRKVIASNGEDLSLED